MESRLKRLEDIEAIRTLKCRYQDAVDSVWRQGQISSVSAVVANLFTDDIEFVAPVDAEGTMVRVRGAREMADFLGEHHRRTLFCIHFVTNGLIDVAGDTATGQWNNFAPGTGPDGMASWYAARYVERYRRTPEGWRIAYSEQVVAFNTPFSIPWSNPDTATAGQAS